MKEFITLGYVFLMVILIPLMIFHYVSIVGGIILILICLMGLLTLKESERK